MVVCEELVFEHYTSSFNMAFIGGGNAMMDMSGAHVRVVPGGVNPGIGAALAAPGQQLPVLRSHNSRFGGSSGGSQNFPWPYVGDRGPAR